MQDQRYVLEPKVSEIEGMRGSFIMVQYVVIVLRSLKNALILGSKLK